MQQDGEIISAYWGATPAVSNWRTGGCSVEQVGDGQTNRRNPMAKFLALTIIAVLAGYAFHALAQIRADVRQQVSAIGSSSSNGISFVWFYDSPERTVYVCRTGQGSGDPVECKARTTLP